ncbi:MAG: hypothetical protein JWM97_2842 [Phycisphaerales bacterium]|nr:hypothetical protein [Phycisphaerales bacterium]
MRRFFASSLVVGSLALAFSAVPASAASGVKQMLNTNLPEVRFNGVALTDAVDFLRDVSGANLVVNWKALEEAGVTKDTQLNIRLRGVSLKKALTMVLAEAGGGDKLTYDIDEGVIQVTTRELADQKMITRVYPVQDLINEIPDFTDAPDFSLNTTSNNQSQSPGGNGGGGTQGQHTNSIFGGDSSSTKKEEELKTKAERSQELLDLIRSVIFPDVWQENGGKAALRMWNGNLIVTAPRSVQEALGGVRD